ncbi:MAG: class I SAM-dependent methyltransferase [Pseudomonadota bacterium]
MHCRHCHNDLKHVFLDLGFAPPSNAYLSLDELRKPEVYYPLKLYVCEECWLVQTEDYAQAEDLFSRDYAYFSSTSKSWLQHAARYCDQVISRFGLGPEHFVIEVAANDGYLLKNFVARNIPCLGVEPTDSTANAAEQLGVPILREFFGTQCAQQLAREGRCADLILGNNVYAHVPDINDFTAGLRDVLNPEGVITLEFPHLMQLIELNQFDTVYHEHFSYLSLNTVCRLFERAGLRVFDVELLPTHGGSLRVYGCHTGSRHQEKAAVAELLEKEAAHGLQSLETYHAFQPRADKVKNDLLAFLIEQKRQGRKVAAYGAAAKGNTLLNYAGVKPDLLLYVCDAAPSKQNKYLPGSHIPVLQPDVIAMRQPDVVLILPWNIREEVMQQLENVRTWGGHFAIAVPALQILE